MFNFTGVLLSANNAAGTNSPIGDWFRENAIEIMIVFIIGFILGAITIEIKHFFIDSSKENKYLEEEKEESKKEDE